MSGKTQTVRTAMVLRWIKFRTDILLYITVKCQAINSTLKQLDAIHHCALRFITGDKYHTHRRVLQEEAVTRRELHTPF